MAFISRRFYWMKRCGWLLFSSPAFCEWLCWWMMCRRGWRRLMTFHIQIRWSDLNYMTLASCLSTRLSVAMRTLAFCVEPQVINLFVQSQSSSHVVKVQHCLAATRLPLIKQNIKNCEHPKNWLLSCFLHASLCYTRSLRNKADQNQLQQKISRTQKSKLFIARGHHEDC